MNHIAAVGAPLIGGLVWMKLGYEIIFLSGAAIAFVTLIVTQWMKTPPLLVDTKPKMLAGLRYTVIEKLIFLYMA